MHRYRKLALVLGTMGILVVGGTAAASTSFAQEAPATVEAVPAAAGGTATFFSDGDRLVVCDRAQDGRAAIGQLRWFGGTWRTNRADGEGDCSNATGNIPEGTPIRVRACLAANGAIVPGSCGDWVSGNA